jgi:hypothetical protein
MASLVLCLRLFLRWSLLQWSLLSLAIAGAPGDGDSFCLSNALSILGPPLLPSNAEVLMDSFDYLTLLSDELGAAWQQVDLDSNNVPGGTTSVSFTEPFCLYICVIA